MQHPKGNDWFPLWVDKWLLGSIRTEFTPAERSVWVDLLCLATKNQGYIGASKFTPYSAEYLANMLNIPPELLATTIAKCLKATHPEDAPKLTVSPEGVYHITGWEKYKLSGRHKSRLAQHSPAEDETLPSSVSGRPRTERDKNRERFFRENPGLISKKPPKL